MPDSTDGSSDSEDKLLSGELGHTKASKLDARANSWSFQAEIRLNLSDAGSDPSARIDLAKPVLKKGWSPSGVQLAIPVPELFLEFSPHLMLAIGDDQICDYCHKKFGEHRQ